LRVADLCNTFAHNRQCYSQKLTDILMYTLTMAERAKIFQNGGSQAVRLPKSCRFNDGLDEVIVR